MAVVSLKEVEAKKIMYGERLEMPTKNTQKALAYTGMPYSTMRYVVSWKMLCRTILIYEIYQAGVIYIYIYIRLRQAVSSRMDTRSENLLG